MEKIIAHEKPDALLPTMGGQTALNTAMKLFENGALARHGVELIGAKADVIDRAEDRLKFRDAMAEIGIESPRSAIAHSMQEARDALAMTGLPAVIRPSFTLGGTGGGVAYNKEEFEQIVAGGLEASPTTEVLIEESVLGWKEYEMEVVRDTADNCIIICAIENVDPMGIHTGDSVTVAPALTLTDKEYQIMRDASIACLRKIGVDTGGSNVQFGLNPADGRMVVIEMNPRVSRSSALASKATGFPIAKIAAANPAPPRPMPGSHAASPSSAACATSSGAMLRARRRARASVAIVTPITNSTLSAAAVRAISRSESAAAAASRVVSPAMNPTK